MEQFVGRVAWRTSSKVRKESAAADEDELCFGKKSSAGEMGHRIAKHVLTSANVLEKSTFYVLDAQGNAMAVYERAVNALNQSVTFEHTEKHIYGSSRLGVMNVKVPMLGSQNVSYSMINKKHRIGERNYELSNHLSNVLSVISDKPIPHSTNGTTHAYYMADILQSTDYSGFGVTLNGRNFTKSGAEEFPYVFQGQESDDEIKGEGNSVNYKYRIYDPRLGRFFAIDPLAKQYPYNSPYAFSENRVIDAIELEGLEQIHYLAYSKYLKKWLVTGKDIQNSLTKNINIYLIADSRDDLTRVKVAPWDKSAPVTWSRMPSSNELAFHFGDIGKQKSQNQQAAVNNSVSKDVTNYDSWEGSASSANGSDVSFSDGLKIMGATAATIFTGGAAAGLFGTGVIGSSAIGGTINAAGNFSGQYVGADNIGDIDGASVVLSGISGALPSGLGAMNIFKINVGLSAIDAGVDVKLNGGLKTIGNNKSWSTAGSDFFFGVVGAGTGGAVQKSGVSNGVQNTRNFVVGGTSQFMNSKVNDKLKE